MGGIGTFKGGFGFPENEQGNIDGIPFYKVSDMNDRCNTLTMKKASNYVTNSQIIKNNWKPFLNQNVIFAKVGAAVYLERKRKAVGPFLLDNNMMVFQPNNANIDYIYYTFQRLQLSKHAQVGTLPSLNASELEKITIFIPSLAEQKVVADLGVTIDHAITLHEEKKRQLEHLKSALLQKMFAEKQRYPVVRFKGFCDEWQGTKLGKISKIVRGASPRPISDPKWFDNDSNVGWLRISDVTSQDGRIHHLEQHISKQGQAKTRVISEPHLLLSIAATVGKPLINYVKTGVHDGFLIFIEPNFDLEFMFQWLEMFRPQWSKYGQPGSQINLNSDLVKNQIINLPSREEQNQIGIFFNQIDSLINLHQQKINNINSVKKSLLQKMFI